MCFHIHFPHPVWEGEKGLLTQLTRWRQTWSEWSAQGHAVSKWQSSPVCVSTICLCFSRNICLFLPRVLKYGTDNGNSIEGDRTDRPVLSLGSDFSLNNHSFRLLVEVVVYRTYCFCTFCTLSLTNWEDSLDSEKKDSFSQRVVNARLCEKGDPQS